VKSQIAILFVLLHMNFTMFVPQLPEMDIIQQNGKPVDDIDCMTEFIDQVILGNKDDTPEDEDNNQATVYYIFQFNYHCISQQPLITETVANFAPDITLYPDLINKKISAISLDIASPPPRAQA
jgi:hypothetical protein